MVSAFAAAPSDSPTPTDADRLYAERVDHLYRLSRPGYAATLVIAAVAAVALFGAVPLSGLVLWFIAVLGVTWGRFALYRAYVAAAPVAAPRRWARRFLVGTAIMGLTWAVLGTLLFPRQLPYQLLVIFAVGGVIIVGAVILAPLPRAFLAFMLPAGLPVIFNVFARGETMHLFMGVMMLAFCGLMARLSPLISELLRDALHVKLENADLVTRLAESNERLRALNHRLTERAVADSRNTEALREASQKFEALLDAAPLAIIVRDAQGRVEKWNPAAERIFGWSELEARGNVVPGYPKGLEEEGRFYRARILRGEAFSNVEAVRLRKDGTPVNIAISGAPLRTETGEAVGVVVIAADITARKRVERRLQMDYDVTRVLAEGRSVAEAIPAVLRTIATATGWAYGARWNLDRKENKLRCVETWCDGTPEREAFLAHSRSRVLAPHGSHGLIQRVWQSNEPEWIEDLSLEQDMRRAAKALEAGLRCAFAFPIRSGEQFYGVMEFFGSGPAEPDAGLMQIVHTTGSQIGQFLARIAAEQDLKFVATHDALTGLPNRTFFGERLSQALAQAQRYNRRVALLFVDLDGFKAINDTLGHDAGDLFLKEAASRLRAGLREGDIVGRIGGDEFVVLIEEFVAQAQLGEIARKIADSLAQPVTVRGKECRFTASVGISTYPQDGRDSQSLLRSADSAMYRAKELGKNRFEFYSA